MKRLEAVPPPQLRAALELVQRRTGLVFLEPRRQAFGSSLLACMRRAGISELQEYLSRLIESPRLFDELAAEITVGETYFLRDPDQWSLLRARLLPQLLARHRHDRPLRIWSAGCASGEEPYSIALALHELGESGRGRIVGSDISRPALGRARAALYAHWALRNVPDDVQRLYFRPVGHRFQLVPWVRGRVQFLYHNLAEESSPASRGLGAMDLILCRNVLIYFDQETVTRVAARLLESLNDGGWLLLGASDPMLSGHLSCEVEVTEAGLLYRKAVRRAVALQPPAPTAAPAPTVVHPGPASPARQETELDRVAQARERYRAKEYAAAAAMLRNYLREGARSSTAEILLVRSLANQGDLVEAGRACAGALDFHRTDPELLFLHAVLLRQAGRQVEAGDALRRALYLDRGFVVAHLALGDVLFRTGDPVAAARSYRNAERLLLNLPPGEMVTASDGEPPARLLDAARARLQLLEEPAA